MRTQDCQRSESGSVGSPARRASVQHGAQVRLGLRPQPHFGEGSEVAPIPSVNDAASAAGAALVRLLSARVQTEADRDYYYQRAEQELALAQGSDNEHIVRFHYHLAGLYLDRVYGASAD